MRNGALDVNKSDVPQHVLIQAVAEKNYHE